MAIAHVQSSGFIAAAGATASFTIPTPGVGNLMVIWAGQSDNVALTLTTPATGWTAMTSATGGTGGSVRAIRGWYKIAAASETTGIVLTGDTGGAWGIGYSEYSGIKNASLLLTDNAQVNASGTCNTPTVTPASGKIALVSFALWIRGTSVTFSSEQVNGSATGVTERVDTGQNNGGGSSQSICVADLLVSSTSGTYQGSATPSGSAIGCGAIAIFEAAAAVSNVSSDRQTRRRVICR